MDRRTFTQSALSTLAATRVPSMLDKLGPIGIQLYTVRDLFRKDPEGTLAALAQAGYAEVEFAGYSGLTAAALKAMLQRSGLGAPSAHVDLDQLRSRWPATLDFAESVGHQHLVLAWLDQADRRTVDDYRRVADQLNRAAATAQPRGISVSYHNHDFEFVAIDGQTPYDVLLSATDPALVKLELDLYWITKGRADPLAYFAKWPGRFPLVHVKDMDSGPSEGMVDVGQGRIDFRRIFAQRTAAGIEHFFVEHDWPKDPMAFARTSHRYLRHLEF